MSTQTNLFDDPQPEPTEPDAPVVFDGEALTLSTFAERAYLDYAISVV